MRKVLFTLLLASAAASPALAQDYHQNDRQQARAERQQAREERQAARSEARPESRPAPSRPADYARPAAPEYQRPNNNFVRQQPAPNGYAGGQNWAAQREQRNQVRDNRVVEQQAQRQDYRQQRPGYGQQAWSNRRPPVVSRTPQPGTQPPLPQGTRSYRPAADSWSNMWRVQPQYDWRNYRNRHRSQFHLGFYYDPFGWGYQRYDIGWRMWPSYYSSQFWINDPWDYRLPYAPPGTHWVRYYNDAILVDSWSGEVVDVIYDFFW